MLLSLSGFLFEDHYTSQSLTFAQFCAIAIDAGYQGVELRRTQVSPDTSGPTRRQLRATVHDHGLSVTCLTARGIPETPLEHDEFFRNYLDLCHDMDCGLLKVSGDPQWLHGVAGMAEKAGVVLASNNHVGGPLETIEGTRRHFQAVGHPNFGLLYDALHLSTRKQDYLGCIEEFAGFTRNILIHSARVAQPGDTISHNVDGVDWAHALPDQPDIAQDWPAVFAAFRRHGYDGLVTIIESAWPTDQRQTVARHCAAAVREVWQEA